MPKDDLESKAAKKTAAKIIALISASQNNAIKANDIFEEQENEDACSAMNTIYYINSLVMSFIIREYSLTPEELSDALHDMIMGVGKEYGAERAKVFMETIQETIKIIHKNINSVASDLEGDLFCSAQMDVAKKTAIPASNEIDHDEDVEM